MLTVAHAFPLREPHSRIRAYLDQLRRIDDGKIRHCLMDSNFRAEGREFDLVHVHERHFLNDPLLYSVPTVFTPHNHSTYCPSRSRYLALDNRPCSRPLSPWGCLWGRLAEGCGERAPTRMLDDWQALERERRKVRRLGAPIVALSTFVRNALLDSGIAPEKVHLVPAAVAAPVEPTPPLSKAVHTRLRLLFVGALAAGCGLEWLFAALQEVDPCIEVDIVGDGPLRALLERQAAKLGISDRLRWHGDGPVAAELWAGCVAVVLPSLAPEPVGIAALQAFSHRRSVIAADVGALSEWVRPGLSGFLLPPGHVEQLAAAIDEVCSSFATAFQLAEQGHVWQQQQANLSEHSAALAQVYQLACAGFGRPAAPPLRL